MLGNTVDERNPAPPKNLRNDTSPVNTNQQGVFVVSKWCERILSQYGRKAWAFAPSARRTDLFLPPSHGSSAAFGLFAIGRDLKDLRRQRVAKDVSRRMCGH